MPKHGTSIRVQLPASPGAEPDGVAPPGAEPDGVAPRDGVALVTLEGGRGMPILSSGVLAELARACARLDADPACRVAVFAGAGGRAFAIGADLDEFASETAIGLAASRRFEDWESIARMRVPTIGVVRGYALGGGLELALSCDMLVLGDDAKLGQPEIRLGLMPGAGGTQRLTRAIGRARAMELILSGRTIDAAEADRAGLATRVVPADEALDAGLALAETIAGMPPLAVRAATEAVRMAADVPLSVGVRHERELFYRLFGTEDKAEGIAAFRDKRQPRWRGR